VWIVYLAKYQKLNDSYQGRVESMYNEFYDAKELFNDYKILLSFASICISFNLLSYFFMIKHTLADSKLEILYFLLFYIILILGFVSMSHLTFGPYIKEYHTFGDAMVECFSIILGDFDYIALENVSATMAFLFFYSYNIIFIFILANMLLAIMNTAYIQSNAKRRRKKSTKGKLRMLLRAFFYCCRRNKQEIEDEAGDQNEDNDDGPEGAQKGRNKKLQNNYVLNELGQMNLQELGIYTKNEEDYRLWAINCAEEIIQENTERAKLREAWYQELEKGESNRIKTIEARVNYWDYMRKAIQIYDLQNGVIEHQNQKLIEKLEAKNHHYHQEVEKTEQMYKYISLLEGPVSANLKIVEECKELKKDLEKYDANNLKLTRAKQEKEEEYE